jgi:hypothetical protein
MNVFRNLTTNYLTFASVQLQVQTKSIIFFYCLVLLSETKDLGRNRIQIRTRRGFANEAETESETNVNVKQNQILHNACI